MRPSAKVYSQLGNDEQGLASSERLPLVARVVLLARPWRASTSASFDRKPRVSPIDSSARRNMGPAPAEACPERSRRSHNTCSGDTGSPIRQFGT